jgi:hypothetical protein
MWKVILISFLILTVIGSGYVMANPIEVTTKLDTINHALREAIVQHEPALALDQLEKLKAGVLGTDLSKVGSVRGVRLLLDSIEQLDRKLHAVKPNFEQISRLGTRVYMAVDALSHVGQPAWLNVEQVVNRHLQAWRTAMEAKASGRARQEWVRVWDVWQQIEPAAWMHTPSSAVEQAHAWMQATNRAMRGRLDYTKLASLMRFERSTIDGLFRQAHPTMQTTTITAASPTIGWKLPATIAAIIVGALSAIAVYTRQKPYISRMSTSDTK